MQRRARPKRYTHVREISFVLIVVLVALTHVTLKTLPADAFQVWFFDVGQGDATLLMSPEGKRLLIDGGPDATILNKLGAVLPPWDRRIDAVLLTHPDADHMLGLIDVLEQYDVETIYHSGTTASNAFYDAWQHAVEQEDAHIVTLKQNDHVPFGSVRIDVLWPPLRSEGFDRNNLSVVTHVQYEETTLLLTGDIEEEVEEIILHHVDVVDVLKAGHHGSLSSSSVTFLKKTKPRYGITSSGEDNRYGHPHPTVLQRFKEQGSHVLRTDQDGDMLLISSGGEPELVAAPLPF